MGPPKNKYKWPLNMRCPTSLRREMYIKIILRCKLLLITLAKIPSLTTCSVGDAVGSRSQSYCWCSGAFLCSTCYNIHKQADAIFLQS